MAEDQWVMLDAPEPTEQEKLFEETHKRSMELVKRIEHMMLSVVKTQVIIEGFMIELLEAHGRDPQRFFYTGKKIEELRDKIDPPKSANRYGSFCRFALTSETSSCTPSIPKKSRKRAPRSGKLIWPSLPTVQQSNP